MAKEAPVLVTNIKTGIARIYKGNTVIGAGFLVQGGYVLTCAHVVRDALGLKPEDRPEGQQVKVNFPYLSMGQKLTTEVLYYRYDKTEATLDEDIAALRVLEPLPEGSQPVKILGSHQLRNPYSVLGFPKGHPKGIASYGELLEELPNGLIQMEDTKAQGLAILPGFSGTPVWDEVESAIVGMVVAREQGQPEAKIGFMMPGRKLLETCRELECLGLVALLTDVADELADAIKLAYRLCCPQGWLVPEDLRDKLQSLQDVKPGTSTFEALDRFVGLLSLPDLNHNATLVEHLQEWLQQRHVSVQPLLQEVQPLLTQHQASQATDTPSHLLIYVRDESTEARFVSALFVQDEKHYRKISGQGGEPVQAPGQDPFYEKVTPDTLPALVQACLSEVSDKSPQRLMLHLILPMDWLTQAQDYDRWPFSAPLLNNLDDYRMGEHCCCMIRITERLNPEILKHFREPWEKKWKQFQNLTSMEICKAFVSGDKVEDPKKLRGLLNQSSNLGLKLSTIHGEDWYRKLFNNLIATGTPVALWLRFDQFTSTICPAKALNELLNCTIFELPEVVKQARATAVAEDEDAHIGHHLSFLWEDPNLVPPSPQTSLTMPQP